MNIHKKAGEGKYHKVSKIRFKIKKTSCYGRGVFADEYIPAGTIIHVLRGRRIGLTESINSVISGDENTDDPLQVGRRTYIDLDELSRTFNHSCDPCAGIRKSSELFALREIKPGEEVTYDYSLTIAPTRWSMVCKCGSKNCRKKIGDVRTIPKKQIQYYKTRGSVQRYMKKILSELEKGTYSIPQYELNALKQLGHS